MIPLILFCLTAGLVSAVLVMLDVISESREPYEAILTLEVGLLYLVNVIIAGLITYVLYLTGRVQLGFLAWSGVVLGYPLLMHTKLFTIKGETAEQNVSVGLEVVYQQVSKLLLPGIDKSIEERGSRLLARFRALPIARIVSKAKDYITPKAIENKQAIMNWLDEMQNDAAQNPEHEDDNKRAIFAKIQEIGGYRGVRYILRG
ncbi:MAG: hypothetical protein FJ014_10140 [Chloroflexi bacterium]|nr:hypothetical protein [Chloroflexota bacterium]